MINVGNLTKNSIIQEVIENFDCRTWRGSTTDDDAKLRFEMGRSGVNGRGLAAGGRSAPLGIPLWLSEGANSSRVACWGSM